jgi:hypothetical protein
MTKKLSPEEIEKICESMPPVGIILALISSEVSSKMYFVYLETKENQFDDDEGDDEE